MSTGTAVTLRTAQAPLFRLANKLGDAKHELQSTVDACGAIVADPSDERSSRATYGPEHFPLGLRPFVSDPMVEVSLKSQFDMDDLGLNDEQLAALETRFKALHTENQGWCHSADKKASTAIIPCMDRQLSYITPLATVCGFTHGSSQFMILVSGG